MRTPLETIVLGGGCFWCTEAVFERMKGVVSVLPGYAGGNTPHPTYKEVSTGTTGHAEVIRVTFDPSQTSLARILALFFAIHDPTTPGRQGNDVGPQYRSIILWTAPAQRPVIEQALLEAQNNETEPIMTDVKTLDVFTPAEGEHLKFYARNPSHPYCTVIIGPKLAKVRELLR